MEHSAATAPTHGWPVECINASKLLETVKKEIVDFDAKQLPKLKGELEAFDKKKKSVVEGYKQKYPTMRARWCRQTAEIERLHRTLVCLFKDSWKDHVTKCVCKYRWEIAEQEAALDKRLKCCRGELEQKREEARAEFKAAELYLKTLTENQQKLDAAAADNAKWIAEINALLQGPESAVAIYVLWFKLLPAQVQMAPYDLVHCLKFSDGQSPADLCPPKPAESTAVPPPKPAPVPHPVPWLVSPEKYEGELDCAWTVYRDASKKQGDAEAAYNANPDDIAAKTKKLGESHNALDGQIRDCLKKIVTTTPCECADDATDASSAHSGGSIAQAECDAVKPAADDGQTPGAKTAGSDGTGCGSGKPTEQSASE